MRLDRLITLTLGRPSPRRHARARIPILMYHSVSDDAETHLSPYYRVCTSPGRFAEHMQWLQAGGFRGVSLEAALQAPADAERLVAITFDDGFEDILTSAAPVLARHNFSATVYLPTSYIGHTRQSFRQRTCLTWSEVRLMREQGIRFGSHTHTHPKLHHMSATQIDQELAVSREILRQELQEEIPGFAYPFAFPQEDARFLSMLRPLLDRHGFEYCATTVIGQANASEPGYFLPRIPVNSQDDEELFTAKLSGRYDWMAIPQGAVRFLKGKSRLLKRSSSS